jgi:hypothetical protein
MASKNMFRVSIPVLLAALALCSSCASTHSSVPNGGATWLEPSPALQRKFDTEAKRVPYTHGVERIELIRWFAGAGEAAYPTLLELAADPRKDVAIAGLAAMGATHDSRLIPYLEKIEVSNDPANTDLRLERARTLLRLGDWAAAPTLISGLSDERMFTRALCSQALNEATHENFGFDPKAEPSQSKEAVAKWEAWWKARAADELLRKPEPRIARSSED